MGNDPDQEKLDNLAERIRAASAKPATEPKAKQGQNPASRIGFDFMGAVIGSAILGVVLDRAFGTKPWGVVVLVIVGFIVGIMNVWRALSSRDTE